MQQRLMTVSTVSRDNGLGVHFDFDKGRRNSSKKIGRNGSDFTNGYRRSVVMQFMEKPQDMTIGTFANDIGIDPRTLLRWRKKYNPADPFGYNERQQQAKAIASDKSNAKEIAEKPMENASETAEKAPILLRYKGLEFSCSDLDDLSLVIRALKMEATA